MKGTIRNIRGDRRGGKKMAEFTVLVTDDD